VTQGRNVPRIPAWLTTLLVIVLILIFSLIIYDARQRQMVDQFNGQQAAIAKGISSGIEYLIAGVEKSLKVFPLLREGASQGVTVSKDRDLKLLYTALEGNVEFLAGSDSKLLSIYPDDFEKNKIDLSPLIRQVEKKGTGFIGQLNSNQTEYKRKPYPDLVIIAVPQRDIHNRITGTLLAAVSLPSILNRYIDATQYDSSCYTWIIDDAGIIVHHPDKTLIGKNASVLETGNSASLRDQMLKMKEGKGVYKLLNEGKVERMIVAYAPISLSMRKWEIAVSTPHRLVIAQLKTTYYTIMIGAFLLISAVAVGGYSMVQFGKKRIRLEEEIRHLREKSGLQEKLAMEKRIVDGIIEGSPIPTFVISRDHRITLWNKACSDLTGYAAEEMIGTEKQYMPFYSEKRPTLADLIIERDKEGKELFLGMVHYYGSKRSQPSAIIPGAYEAYDYYSKLGGTPKHLYFLAAPIYNENKEVIAAIETLQDVSRVKQMELNLKEYAESLKDELDVNINLRKGIENLNVFLESVIKSSPDKIYVLENDGMVYYVSRGFDGSNLQTKGTHMTETVDPDNRALVLEKWECAKKGIFTPYEIEVRLKNGSTRNLLLSVTPIKGMDKFIIVQRDITEIKKLEKKFYESQRLAAVGQLSAGIAHEVRNPLSSIKMSLQILRRRLQPEGNDLKRFNIAEEEVEHLEKLVSDILIYARPDELDLRLSDLNEFIRSSLKSAEKEIMEKNIKVHIDLSSDIQAFKFDNGKLRQALLNIYLNAVDAMSEEGSLSITTKTTTENKMAEIVVEDNGCGIDEKDFPYIFNPFFTKKSYGTGLGLTQVKKIIDLHQGTLEIFSQPGRGTRVVITLPVVA